MKTVFTDISQVAHLWANQLQESARNSGNYYFNGDAIYSYGSHFMIAKHHENKKGNVILFTTRSYSNTTAKQIGVTRAACSHKDLIYCKNPNGSSHSENFDNWAVNMQSSAKSLVNARKPEKYLNDIAVFYNEAKTYADYFSLKIPKDIIVLSKIGNKDEYFKLATKQAALKLKEEKRNKLKLQKQHAEALVKWRTLETNRLAVYDGYSYLRVTDKNRIQTSQNVDIPMQIAKDFYDYILNTIETGGCTDCNKKLMDFNVTSIDKNLVVVGCHKTTMQEIKGIANQLGW